MKFQKNQLSIRTLAAALAAVLLFACGGVMFARAALTAATDNLDEAFELDHIDVQLMENGEHVGKTGDSKGQLLGYMKEKIIPGKSYKEEVAAKNATGAGGVEAVDQFVRIIIKKYWINPDGSKDTTMDPGLIKLSYGSADYNEGPWRINEEETTAERTVYYYTKALSGQEVTPPVIDSLKLDSAIISEDAMQPPEESDWTDGKKTYTYKYKYDGKTICVEADAQALQPHNVNDAIESAWGVENVRVSEGALSVQ